MNAIFSCFSSLVTTLVLKPLDHILFFGTGVLYKSKETMVQEMAADWVKRSEAFSKEFGLAKHGHSSSSFAPVTVAVSAIADDDDISGGEWPDGEKFGAPRLFANSIDTDVGGRYYEHSISETDLPETEDPILALGLNPANGAPMIDAEIAGIDITGSAYGFSSDISDNGFGSDY